MASVSIREIRCVVLEGRPEVADALRGLLSTAGIEFAGQADSFAAGVALVLREQPEVVVVELALTGLSGLPALRALQAASPACSIVALSPFGDLETAAKEAGAIALCDDRDLRGLATVLAQLAGASPTQIDLRTVSTKPLT